MQVKQVQLETMGCILSFRAALQAHDLRDWTLVTSNDATGALVALLKGFTTSPTLPGCSIGPWTSQCWPGMLAWNLFPHATGLDLIHEQIDNASLNGAMALHGPGAAQLIH